MRTSSLHSLALAAMASALYGSTATACAPTAAEPSVTSASPASAAKPAALAVTAADPALDDRLVGTTVPAWSADAWINGPPLTLAGLRGRVVLVRWFTDSSCPYCSATAPSLNAFHRDYQAKGLTVVGMYHHKDPAPLKPGEYEALASRYGFGFPVALDTDWRTLKAWWLDGGDRKFTSVSFLLDRQGRVRGIHKGGRYAPGDADYEAMKRGIEVLLAER